MTNEKDALQDDYDTLSAQKESVDAQLATTTENLNAKTQELATANENLETANQNIQTLTNEKNALQDDYDTLTEQLNSIRGILTDVAIVDIHLANGKYTNYEAATMYSEILDGQLDVLIPKINSMNLQKKQEPIRETMESLLSYDLALYLQNITAGLKSGDAKTVQAALEYREKSLKTYEILEDSIEVISDELKLNDAAYYEWELYESAKKKDSSAVFIVKGENNHEQ